MDRRVEIRNAYRVLGKEATFYDGMITCSTFMGRAICRFVWNMDEEKNARYITQALDGIPGDFAGKMLEVPVGTGVLTMPVYKAHPRADVTCLDYSEDMMRMAGRRAQAMGLEHVRFVQGDVGALPFEDDTFDLVLSLNGFHAFPDKEAAYRETMRVLKPGGIFCGCFYVEGENRRTDALIRRIYVPKGFFTPPFETVKSLQARLSAMYARANVTAVESMACFVCEKG